MNNDNSAKNSDSDPRTPTQPGTGVGSETWWDLRPPNRSAAAYKAGRFLSQLQWHSQIAFLRCEPRHERIAHQVLDRLAELSHDLDPDSLDLLQEPVEAARRRLMQSWGCERAADDWQEANEQCHWDTKDQPRGHYCEDLLKLWVCPCLDEFRKAIKRNLTPEEVRCFDLGEFFDHGIRRPDFYNNGAIWIMKHHSRRYRLWLSEKNEHQAVLDASREACEGGRKGTKTDENGNRE